MGKTTRKNNHCLKLLGVASSAEVAKESAPVASSEPVPMLTITDVEMERFGEPLRTDGPLSDAPAGIGLHVCGDAAVRLPEVLMAMRGKSGIEQQQRAALLVAASQASYVGNVGSALAAGYVNSAVASSKKISVADVNRLMFLSPFDCYVAGLANLDKCFEGSAYEGVYGCRVDHGFTMPGRDTKEATSASTVSDSRQPHPTKGARVCGNCCLPRRRRTSSQCSLPSRTGWFTAEYTSVPLAVEAYPTT